MENSLYTQFSEIVDRGDEAATKDFLIEHIKEFPEDMQDKIIVAFFSEALEEKANTLSHIADFQKEALAALSEIEKTEQLITDKKKEIEVRENLNK